ncbi:MAG TPA: hypothetical protein VFJ19_20695 [Nocardioidaceae bacterium]|nr:hypothetical protein [Nocardioidaceae bacterium]
MTDSRTHDLLLPEGSRLLHIGATKTGSTSLQLSMYDAREEMLEHGVRLVGGDLAGRAAVKAALRGELDDDAPARQLRRWEEVVEEISTAVDPRVCLSNGSLCEIEQDRARAMVEALGGDRAHVVAVCRGLDRLLPSQWQESVRDGTVALPYEAWLETVLGDHPDDPSWQHFWTPHDIERLVDRWVAVTARDRFTLVVADDGDRLALSHCFEQMLGLPEGMLAPQESQRRNESASAERVEAVRLLNERLVDRPWPEDIKADLRSRVAKRIRSAAPAWPGESRIPPMPGWAADRVRELSERREKTVRSLGVQVIGDPAHLRPSPTEDMESVTSAPDTPYTVSTELAAEMVVTAIGGAVQLLKEQRKRDRRQVGRLRRQARGSQPPRTALAAFGARDLARELGHRIARRLTRR